MKALIVLAHPEPRSFNSHLASSAAEALQRDGHSVVVHDLYASDFDPREGPEQYRLRRTNDRFDAQVEQRYSWDQDATPSEVKSQVEQLLECDLLIVQFPLWWFGPPAILKGWLDRVFVYGGLYRSSARHDHGLLKGKRVIASVTTGSSEQSCSSNGSEGDTSLMLWPFLYSFRYVGFDVLEPHLIHGVRGGLEGAELDEQNHRLAQREQEYLYRLKEIDKWSSVRYNANTDFDQNGQLKPNAPVFSPFIRHSHESNTD